MGFLSKNALKRKLGPALIYSPFIRLLLFNTWFQLVFGAAFSIAVITALCLPKIWKTSPSDFLPVVKVSALDLMQNWSLKRSARKLMESGEFARASRSWEAAVAQNPADLGALRGYLANTINITSPDRHTFRSAVSQMNWLFRLAQTNASDVVLAAKVCDKLQWHDVAAYYLGNVQRLPPEAEATYLKALFQLGRIAEFEVRFEKHSAGLSDEELPLYAMALEAGRPGPKGEQAAAALASAAASGEHTLLATRLHMIAAGRKSDVEAYARDLQNLAMRNGDNVADHALYWILLKGGGREAEATQLAKAFTRAPTSATETVRLADAYFQLGLFEAARELMRKTAPGFAHSPDVWLAYAAVLERLNDWSQLRAIALQIREQLSNRDTLWGYAYYLEGRAELAGDRVSFAERAFEKASECSYEIPSLGLAVARELSRLDYPHLGLKLFHKLENSFQGDPVFWEAFFDAAFNAQDSEHVLKASERCYALKPRDVNAQNRYAAALLVNRTRASEIIQLTVQLVANFPHSLAAKINHAFALLINQRSSEALALLEAVDPTALSASEASDYHLALFEAYHNLQRWKEAEQAAARIVISTLFPPQRKWLTEKLSALPKRQMAGTH